MMRLECLESPLRQRVGEAIPYALITTPWGGSPSSVAVSVWDEQAANADVTNTVMPTNSPSVLGDTITLSELRDLTANKSYRVNVQFVSGGRTQRPYFVVKAEA